MRAEKLAGAALDRRSAARRVENRGMKNGNSGNSIRLPIAGGGVEEFKLSAARQLPDRAQGPFNRIAFSAAHVVSDPLADNDPWLEPAVDWDRTIAYREYLWDLGLGVAEAMDTAQRGMGMDWPSSRELIRRSVSAGRARGALIFSGAGTDHIAPA